MSLFILLKCLNAVLFISLAGLHVYWAFTSHMGWLRLVVPEQDHNPAFRPGRLGTLLVAVGLLGLAFTTSWAMRPIYKGVSPFMASPWWCVYGNLAIAVVFFLRFIGEGKYIGIFKRITHTRFAQYDTLFYSPLCLCIALVASYIYLQIK